MDKVRIGIIGCGGIANGKHMPSLKKLPDVEMVAFCDIVEERAQKAAREYGVEFLYRDFRPYFRAGQERARELGFYIQKYCGCVFSEEERYLKKSKIIP